MDQEKSLLKPYKALGIFTDNNKGHIYNAGEKQFMAFSTGNSFKVYKLPDMKIKLAGPYFNEKISCIQGINENIFLGIENKIYKMKFYHIEQIYSQHKYNIQGMVLLGADYLISWDDQNNIIVRLINTDTIVQKFQADFQILQILHPFTYLNKVVLIGKQTIQLINIVSGKIIFDFQQTLENLVDSNLQISCAEVSPILDLLSFALTNGKIIFLNIRTNQILFSFMQCDYAVIMSFSKQEIPLLACGDNKGNINFWDLNEKKIFSSIKGAHQAKITSLIFLPNELGFISASGDQNNIIQWHYDELSESKFSSIRERSGLTQPIKKLRFYGDEGLHVLASSLSQECELRDFSLLNEAMSLTYSLKKNTQLQKQNKNTESLLNIGQIQDFGFSLNREKDWSNVLTSHKNNQKPCLWSGDNKSIVKQRVEVFETFDPQMEGVEISTVFVSNCGNFGIIGFKNGFISKINMQSGLHQISFNSHKSEISSISVDLNNKILISSDISGILNVWDFYSGKILNSCHFDKKILFIRMARFSILFLVVLADFTMEVWDNSKFNRARTLKGHHDVINDAFFSHDNKFIFSCSKDRSLIIWDLIGGQPISNIQLDSQIISMDCSSDGELVVTAIEGKREIFIWHNLVYMKPWGTEKIKLQFESYIKVTSGNPRERFYEQKSEMIEEEKVDNEKLDELENEKRKQLIQYTQLPYGSFMPLVHLDEIKEKSKPQNQSQVEFKIPFYLDFQNKEQKQQEFLNDLKKEQSEKSRIIQNDRDKYLDTNGSYLEQFLNKSNTEQQVIKDVFQYFKSLSPSQFDFQLRKNLFGNSNNLKVMLELFNILFDDIQEYDIKQIYLKVFLDITYDQLMLDSDLKCLLEQLQQKLLNNWTKLDGKFSQVLCLLENFAKVKA